MTEASAGLVICPLRGWRYGSVGMLLPNTTCRVRQWHLKLNLNKLPLFLSDAAKHNNNVERQSLFAPLKNHMVTWLWFYGHKMDTIDIFTFDDICDFSVFSAAADGLCLIPTMLLK